MDSDAIVYAAASRGYSSLKLAETEVLVSFSLMSHSWGSTSVSGMCGVRWAAGTSKSKTEASNRLYPS